MVTGAPDFDAGASASEVGSDVPVDVGAEASVLSADAGFAGAFSTDSVLSTVSTVFLGLGAGAVRCFGALVPTIDRSALKTKTTTSATNPIAARVTMASCKSVCLGNTLRSGLSMKVSASSSIFATMTLPSRAPKAASSASRTMIRTGINRSIMMIRCTALSTRMGTVQPAAAPVASGMCELLLFSSCIRASARVSRTA